MGMIICTECGKKFSDKAVACPNCGIPMEDVLEELKRRKEEDAAKPAAEEKTESQFPQNAQPTKEQKKEKAGGFVLLLLAGILTLLYLGFAIPDYCSGELAVKNMGSGLFSLVHLSAPDLLGICGISVSSLADKLGRTPESLVMLSQLILTGTAFICHFLGMMIKIPVLLLIAFLLYLLAMVVAPECFMFLILETIFVLIGWIRMRNSLR